MVIFHCYVSSQSVTLPEATMWSNKPTPMASQLNSWENLHRILSVNCSVVEFLFLMVTTCDYPPFMDPNGRFMKYRWSKWWSHEYSINPWICHNISFIPSPWLKKRHKQYQRILWFQLWFQNTNQSTMVENINPWPPVLGVAKLEVPTPISQAPL